MEEDKQLERLYDYTKFHIGIYLSASGGITAALGSQAADGFLPTLVKLNNAYFYAALVFMVFAGICGGIVASSTIECKNFNDFWNHKHGPQSIPVLRLQGSTWAMLEHVFFWISLLILGYVIAFRFP